MEDGSALASAVAASGLDEPLKAALIAGNLNEVRTLMGQRPMVAVIMPAEEEEEGEEEKEDSPDPVAPTSGGADSLS